MHRTRNMYSHAAAILGWISYALGLWAVTSPDWIRYERDGVKYQEGLFSGMTNYTERFAVGIV